MFDRRYNDRKVKRLRYDNSIEVAFKLERVIPIEDVEFDPVDLDMIDDNLNWYYLAKMSPELWDKYTTIVPFCTVPVGGTYPKKQGGRMKNPFRKPTEMAAIKNLASGWALDAKDKSDELPPLPTFEEQLARAGGRSVSVPCNDELVAWHEQDPT